jgi:hypothetical protein
MMRLLYITLRKEAQGKADPEGPNIIMSHLYSDVGEFYERFGWKTYPAPEVRFPLDDGQPGEEFETHLANSVEWISDDELPSIIEEDGRILLDEVAAKKDTVPIVCLVPTAETFLWQQGRMRLYASKIGIPNVRHCGVRIPGTSNMALWIYFFIKKSSL